MATTASPANGASIRSLAVSPGAYFWRSLATFSVSGASSPLLLPPYQPT